MTSTVKVTAHCAGDKQVRIQKTGQADVVLQDGESHETVVYDDVQINVKEELTSVQITDAATSVDVGGDGPVKP